MVEEVKSFVRVWLFAVPAAHTYCYFLPSLIRPGKWRFLAVLPVVVLFSILPFSFSTMHLRMLSAAFLCWLATFKLFLFAFDRGPLCDGGSNNRLSLPAFVAIASLPIMIKKNPPHPLAGGKNDSVLSLLGFAAKGLLLALISSFSPMRHRLPRVIVLSVYSLCLYLEADLIFAGIAAVGRAMLPTGTALEPQFAAPYLSSSLQVFWGRRWNIMVTYILRATVYDPIRALWCPAAGVIAAFLVSGLMHDFLFSYLTLQWPTWEVTLFFVLHGICTVAEVAAKRWWTTRGMKPLHPALTVPLTVSFVLGTSWWLFMPQVLSVAEDHIVNEARDFFSMLEGAASSAWR